MIPDGEMLWYAMTQAIIGSGSYALRGDERGQIQVLVHWLREGADKGYDWKVAYQRIYTSWASSRPLLPSPTDMEALVLHQRPIATIPKAEPIECRKIPPVSIPRCPACNAEGSHTPWCKVNRKLQGASARASDKPAARPREALMDRVARLDFSLFTELLARLWVPDRITQPERRRHQPPAVDATELSTEESFIAQNAATLVQKLAYDCASAAKEICQVLGDHLPNGANPDSVFLLILGLRGAVDAEGVRRVFGKRAFEILVKEIGACFSRKTGKEPGGILSLLVIAEQTMAQEPDPREWMRRYSMKLLQTRDPEDEVFHATLAYAFTFGEPIVSLLKRECRG